MLTREERQRLEAQWSSDDRSIASFARLLKSGVLGIMVLGLLWIAGTGERQDVGQQTAAPISRTPSDGSAVRASQQVYDERRAQWEGKPAPRQQAASR